MSWSFRVFLSIFIHFVGVEMASSSGVGVEMASSSVRIVLLGKNVSENNRVGNTILDKNLFDSEAPSHLHQPSQRISGEVEKRHITFINTPLLQQQLPQHKIIQGVRECVSLSAPGPHVIVLVLQYNDFSEEDRNRVKYVLNLFSGQAIEHTIVVTTDEVTLTSKLTSKLWDNAIHNLIKECGGGHLPFDKENPGWRSEMIRRVEEMLKKGHKEFLICNVYRDRGAGTSVDEDSSRSGGSVRGDDKEKDGKFNQSTKTGSDGGVTTSGKTKLNIVLCGYNTTLKSSVSKIFRGTMNKQMNIFSHQKERSNVCVKKEGQIDGRQITLIELPALTRLSEEEVMRETLNCLFLCDPGVHLFILVTPFGSLTNEDKAEMETIKRIFNSKEHFMVLWHDHTVDKGVSDSVASTESQRFVSLYGSWYSVMGLKDQRNSGQISKMLDCIDTIKIEPYSLQMYMRAPEKRVRHELEEKLSERENEIKELEEKIKTLVPEGVKLNLVVCGSDRRLKSFISNLILNQSERGSELSSECVRRDVKVCEHLVSLVELPALINTQLSEEEVMRQTLHCVSLCDPGVHVFLIIIPDGPINNEDRAEMDKIQKIFSSRINKHIMILIMQNPEHQTAELNEETQSVIESFGGRHHFIGPNTQVSMLMEKLKQMVGKNSGVCFSTETLLEAQMEKLQTFEEMKKRIQSLQTWFQSQDSRESEDDLRIVLLGKTGLGKSSTGNTILGRVEFTAVTAHESVTKECQRETSEINGRHVTVIDTPGLFDTELTNEKIQREISNCIPMILPGPHVFIIVLSLAQRFTQEEETSVKLIQEMFGENSSMYTMVLFTGGERLENKTIEEFLGKPGSALMNLIEACGNRYHVFNNKQTGGRTQVSDLLKKIDDMVKANGGSFYSCKMFREMERKTREEEFREKEEQYKRHIKESEEKERKIREELKTEREEWEREKQEERQKRRKIEQEMWDEYNQREERYKKEMKRERHEWERQKQEEMERRRKIDQETWDVYYEKLKQETEKRHAEREALQVKHEEEKERMKMMMEEERQYIENHEREMREEMKREREEWERQKQERQREEEENKANRFNQLYRRTPEGQNTNNDEDSRRLRILMFGKTGNGKSAAGNTILGKNEFHSEDNKQLVTTTCKKGVGEVDGKAVAVVDTPGLFDLTLSKEQMVEEIMNCVSLSAPGPHVFVIVLSLGRITQEKQDTLEIIKKIFGPKAAEFSIVLFTRGDELKKQTIKEYVEKSKNDELKKLIRDCGNRFLAFNNRETQDQTQVTKLLNMIEELKKSNEGRYFTNEMFEAAISIEKRREMIQKNERKNQAQVEELEAKYEIEDLSMRKTLEEEKQKTEVKKRLMNRFSRKEETLRKEFEEKEKSEQKKQEMEDQKRSEEEKQQRAEHDQRIDEMKREIENQRLQYEKLQKEREEEDRKREEEYKQDQEKMKNEQERILAELRKKQEKEIKKRDSEEQVRKEQEEKEREEWKRKLKEAENDKKEIQEGIKQEQREWEEEKKRQMREQEEQERKIKEKYEEQLREKQEELKKMRERFETEREEERQMIEEERQKLEGKKEQVEREYEEKRNEMKSHYEQLERERKEEWEKRKREDEERRSERKKRWEKMIEGLKQEQEEEIKRRQENEDRIQKEQLNDFRKRKEQFKEKLEQLYEMKRLKKELDGKYSCHVM